ncbi:hypothetical protein QJQ45_028053 [Haematococcus lacustris]|nr:hypothetical protein QJQ45_028053 [Haematococcus lacustris]
MSGPHILWPPTDTEGDAGCNRKRCRLSGERVSHLRLEQYRHRVSTDVPTAAAGTCSSWPPSSSSSGSARCKAYGCSSQQATVIGVPVAYWQPLGLLPAYQPQADPTHPAHPPTPLAASPATSTSGSCSPPPPCPTAPRSPSPTSPPRPPLPLALQPDAATSAATSTSARKPGLQQASSSTTCLPAPPPAPTWQSAADLPHRLGIARGITHILQARCPQLPPPTRLALTRAMEVALYRAAPSPAAYLDASSLPARVLGVLRQRLAAAARRRAGLRCKASSGPCP